MSRSGGPACAQGEPNAGRQDSAEKSNASASYCGVHCLYSAMRLFDINVQPEQLLRPEYIGSAKGSSLAELKKAAEDHGLFATAVSKMTARELQASPYPIILHVRSSPTRRVYDHYVLFLGASEGQASVYDPPKAPELVSFYDLAPRWDGTGLVVSNQAVDLGRLLRGGRVRFALFAAVAAAMVLFARWVSGRLRRYAGRLSSAGRCILSMGQCALLMVAAVPAGFVYHFVSDQGFIAYAASTDAIRKAYQGSFIPRISEGQIRRLGNENEVVFVDVRYPYEFEAAHVDGAVNITVVNTNEERRRLMNGRNRRETIIIYYGNSRYDLAEIVAVRLVEDGFKNIFIYPGKWEKLAGYTRK